ncbi:MAG: hypothetical protein R3D71_06705 [Rickettsiales bacterium]
MRKEEIDFDDCKRRWREAPRLKGVMNNAFNRLAGGKEGVPPISAMKSIDLSLLKHDAALNEFAKSYIANTGHFRRHFTASIPYVLQQDINLGNAITEFVKEEEKKKSGEPVSVWTVGNSEGVLARTISYMSKGNVHTLTNNEAIENLRHFNRNKYDSDHFHHAPFFEVTSETLKELKLPEKFSAIHQSCTFQMFSSDRKEQVAYISKFLDNDGVYTAIEKCTTSLDEYINREAQKDEKFKSRYFTKRQIEEKKGSVLQEMSRGMVPLEKLIKDTAYSFPHIAIVWNSGNFYTIVASKNPESVKRFCSHLMSPLIPKEFNYHKELPDKASGLKGVDLQFREPEVFTNISDVARFSKMHKHINPEKRDRVLSR